ncbi:YwqH-like family protein [Virgibacillus halodenitrificans]|uniref:YwqH-like family protein n=1 Tax=Virgibacillus halodenitrificans TaxID=1482 RepID=UPI000EF48E75|nr:DUF5082 family protein [Virgibacillus halodenitrificans]
MNNMDLYSINTELMELQRLMGAANLQITEKEEELRRLKEALTKLSVCKIDFTDPKSLCLAPEFSSTTLHGDNANKLDSYRKKELQVSYNAISDEQISNAEEKISQQIEIVTQEISDLKGSVSSMQTQHTDLTNQKREVKNQS